MNRLPWWERAWLRLAWPEWRQRRHLARAERAWRAETEHVAEWSGIDLRCSCGLDFPGSAAWFDHIAEAVKP